MVGRLEGNQELTFSPGSEEKIYTYTIITTSSNKQLNFLHDRMPVILENGSDEVRTWLDPKRSTWSKELQSLLRPFQGEVEVYPVSKDVGKVGNNSPNFIIPVASSENKSNIANFFAKGTQKGPKAAEKDQQAKNIKSDKVEAASTEIKHEAGEDRKTLDHSGTEDNAPLPVPKEEAGRGMKHDLEDVPDDEPPSKAEKLSESVVEDSSPRRKTRSATSNKKASPKKALLQEKGAQKITSFFVK